MNCMDILDKLSDYLDKELDPSLCQEIEKHVEDCEPCIAFINTLKKTVSLFNGQKEAGPEIPKPVSTNLKDFLKDNIAQE